jgi:radical SAM superfamily enzyme YgiQ (UPF0313 family)
MRILFISAERHPKPNYLAIGPSYLSAQIKSVFPETEITFCNQGVYQKADELAPDMVLISSISESYPTAREYARHFSELSIPVVLGGSHITAAPFSLDEAFSLAVLGEGENTIIDVLKHYVENGRSFDFDELRSIPGIAFRDSKELFVTPPREPIADLDTLPFPDRSIYTLSPNYPVFSITSRGCPFRCIYCASSNMAKGVRYHGVDYVAEDVSRIVADHKPRVIYFVDDLFCAKLSRVEQIAETLKRKGITKRTQFIVTCRADLVTDKLARALKMLNTKTVSIGFESGSQKVLRYLKGTNSDVAINERAVNILNRHDIRVIGFFIIGTPIDTTEDIQATYDFVRNHMIDYFSVYPLTPLPGTPLWRYCKERKIVTEDASMNWSQLNLVIDDYIHLPKEVSQSELRAWFDKFKKLKRVRLLQSILQHFKASPFSLIRFLFDQIVVEAKRRLEKYGERR